MYLRNKVYSTVNNEEGRFLSINKILRLLIIENQSPELARRASIKSQIKIPSRTSSIDSTIKFSPNERKKEKKKKKTTRVTGLDIT